MELSLKPSHLKRYKDIASLVMKYRKTEMAKAAGSDGALVPEDELPVTDENQPSAEQLADDLEKLGPTFIKLGQLLSTRAEFLPPAAMEALARLQDDVAPFPFEDVERIVEEELGVRISKAFATFDREPLAAASLGQVHRATLRDGREVVVKVQRPGIREKVTQDLEAFEELAAMLDKRTKAGERYRFGEMMDEFRKTLLAELDYRREAQNLTMLRRNLAQFERIVVPAPIDDYSSSKVLTMDYVGGVKVTKLAPVALNEIDGEGLADELFKAYLKQIFVDGFFHADPHPGNVFLTDDNRIALLDLGMVARIAPRMQEHLLQMVLAIADSRTDEVADYAIKIGEPADWFDEKEFRRRVADVVLRNQDVTLGNIKVGQSFLEMARHSGETGIFLPPELTMLGKALLNLDGIGRTIAPDFDPNAAIRHDAMKIMNQRMLKTISPANIFTTVLEMKDLVDRLPSRVNKILDNAAENKLAIKVDTGIDAAQFAVGLQKVANRIALGLVLAALIVGASLLMQIRTRFTILGYPGFAMLCFLAAAAGGFMLVVQTFKSDVPTKDAPRPTTRPH